MSRLLSPTNFTEARKQAMRLVEPSDYRGRQAWLGDWRAAMGRLAYLELRQAETTEGLDSLLRLKAKLKKPNLSLDLIKPDIETLWRQTCESAQEAAHAFEETPTGFRCSFYAVSDAGYVTGVVEIDRHS